jgi:hypothetical protein
MRDLRMNAAFRRRACTSTDARQRRSVDTRNTFRRPYSRHVRVAVEQVIQTATKVVDGGLAAREAVTVLATLTREAVPAARELREADPDRAATYRELILALGQELRRLEPTSDDPRHLHAVTEDLAEVLQALA